MIQNEQTENEDIDLNKLKEVFYSCTDLKEAAEKLGIPNNKQNLNMIKKLADKNKIYLKHKDGYIFVDKKKPISAEDRKLIEDKIKFFTLARKSKNISVMAKELGVNTRYVLTLAKKYNVDLHAILASDFEDELSLAAKNTTFCSEYSPQLIEELNSIEMPPSNESSVPIVKSSSQNHFELVYRLAPGQTVTVTDGVVTIK